MTQGQPGSPSTHDFLAAGPPTPEDLVLLQSAVDGLRNERDSLIRRLQAAESTSREKTQLVEARWREASTQVDALKKSAQAQRARWEAGLTSANKRADQAQTAVSQWRATAEQLRAAKAELAAVLDAAQCRVADLETESGIYEGELKRLQAAQNVAQDKLTSATATLEDAQKALAEQQTVSTAHLQHATELEQELAEWQATTTQREADLVAARDEIARELENEQSQAVALQQQIDNANAQLCAAESKAHAATQEALALHDELHALRNEIERERGIYEAVAQQREAELQQRLDELGQAHDRDIARRNTQLAALTSELAEAQQTLLTTRDSLTALRADGDRAAQDLAAAHTDLEEGRRQVSQLQLDLINRSAEFEARLADLSTTAQDRDQLRAQLDDIRQQLESERMTLRSNLQAATKQQAQLTAQVTQLQTDLTVLNGRRQATTGNTADIERERGELRLQVEKLSGVIRQIGQEREEHRVNALRAQQSLGGRIDELTAERHGLTLRMAELETLTSQLERECDRLRRERTAPDELRRYKSEATRLESKLEELERQRGDAAQNHSAAVAGYMVELNQRSDALHTRELELQKLTEELNLTRQTCEDAVAQVSSERHERVEIARQLDELRKVAAAGSARPAGNAPLCRQGSATPATSAATAASSGGSTKTSAPPATNTKPPAPPTATAKPNIAARAADGTPVAEAARNVATRGSLAHLTTARPLTVVHLEESKDLRESVRSLVSRIPEVRYVNTVEAQERSKSGDSLLIANLLNRVHDPLAAITSYVGSSPDHQNIFAYCADGNSGFTFGEVTFFSHSIDPDACVAWLMETCGAVQRLLAASNNIEMTSNLRTVLTRIRCSASVALDLRQVMDLIPMIQPEALLVDLSLPRAEGLRLINRLRSDPKTRSLPVGVLLPEPQKMAEFRQHAVRAAREGSIGPEILGAALAEQMSLPAAATPAAGPPGIAQATG